MSISSYMNLKSFHPGNFFNQRKVWIAEQKAEAEKKKKAELEQQYKVEQHELAVKAQLLGEDTRKLELNFMYKEPPGLKEAQEKLTLRQRPRVAGDEKDGKKSLQEKHPALKGAPREGSYTEAMATVRDRPFGVEVRNVKCTKCGQWGHQNTDRVCPRYYENGPRDGSDKEIERPAFQDPATLIKQMREDQGLALRRSVIGRQNNVLADNQQLVMSSEEDEGDDPELAFLKTLSAKEKRKLLKKLAKLEGDESGGVGKSKKKKKKSRKHKRRHSCSDDSSLSSEEDRPSKRKKSAHEDTSDQHEHRRGKGSIGSGERNSQVGGGVEKERYEEKGRQQRVEETKDGGRREDGDRGSRGHEQRREERGGSRHEEWRRERGDGKEERRDDGRQRHDSDSRREERERQRESRGDERDERWGDVKAGKHSHRDRR
eukprot:comp15152_c0_seq1/m.11850 comp15152_c0_seq1/g.11850  ORF comp15152_c0_seq1/g.11850 comp15152_c0_seq1/m.11850 type:complete len:430 (-) comp15152_c0_seq1:190-1479(-)